MQGFHRNGSSMFGNNFLHGEERTEDLIVQEGSGHKHQGMFRDCFTTENMDEQTH